MARSRARRREFFLGTRTKGVVLKPPRACIECCSPVPEGGRCPNPACPRSRRRPASRGPDRSHAERARRKKVVEAWRRQHGDVCPGFGVPAHTLEPGDYLTADHVVPTSLGGDPAGPLQVLCAACNVRKGGRNRLKRRGAASG
jgi:5-methylcytosine-specific restriction enzyme A